MQKELSKNINSLFWNSKREKFSNAFNHTLKKISCHISQIVQYSRSLSPFLTNLNIYLYVRKKFIHSCLDLHGTQYLIICRRSTFTSQTKTYVSILIRFELRERKSFSNIFFPSLDLWFVFTPNICTKTSHDSSVAIALEFLSSCCWKKISFVIQLSWK